MVESDASPSLLNGFGGRIGGDELVNLLSHALTALERDYFLLNNLLLDHSWDLAAKKAHQLKGGVYLFDCGEMLYFLEQIAEQNTVLIATLVFRENFRRQTDLCLNRVNQALEVATARSPVPCQNPVE